MKNKIITICLAISFFLGISADLFAKDPFSIVAVVNNDAVSSSDVEARMQLMLASSGLQNTPENRQRMETQVINTLIEEQLKIQEAANQDITVSPEEISEGFEGLATQNKLTAEEFSKILETQGIPKSTLTQQIKSQIAWSKIITQVLRPQIDVTEADLNARMQRIKENIGKEEYKVGEIFLPVVSPDEDQKTKQLAEKIIVEMKEKNVPFEIVAAQFSKAPGAQQNGGLNWVQKGQLPKDLEGPVLSLTVNEMTAPIRGLSGYHIMMLKETRVASEDNIPEEQEITNQIGLERLDRLQQRHLSDIKAASFIDRR